MMPSPVFYKWETGFRARVKADVAGAELERIRDARGSLTADIVRDEARDKANPLHPQIFDLSVKKAAEAHYLRNAQQTIRAIQVVFEDVPDAPVRRFDYVTVADAKGGVGAFAQYDRVEDILSDPEKRAVLLARALREAEQWRRRYSELHELSSVFAALEKVAVA